MKTFNFYVWFWVLAILFQLNITNVIAQTASAPTVGDGSSESPFEISSLENLYWIAADNANWNLYYIQTANIDAASTSTWDDGDGDDPDGWTPIGNSTTKFTGSYDGDGYTIDGLYIYRSNNDYQGMFGATNGAVIKNLAVTGIHITGKQNTGGLIGYSHSSNISNSCTTGSVSGSGSVGGFVGWSEYGSMSKCYSSCNVSCSGGAGGFIGYCSYYCTVANCYSTGTVTGNNSGGFIQGNMYATVSNCYSIGIVSNGGGFIKENYGTINNCFWDTDVSGQSTSSGGTGKTTAEMKSHSTFTEAGWDFFDETTNGSNDYWGINETGDQNSGYPFLEWQGFDNKLFSTVTTQSITDIASTSATGNGNITEPGIPNSTGHGVCWNTTGTPTTDDSKTNEGAVSATGAFTSSITELSSSTTYYVRAYAINEVGTAYGDEVSFTTLQSPEVSTLTTDAVTNIATTTATGNGNITILGTPNPTSHGVCWNTTGTPTIDDSKTDEGSASTTGAFTSSISGLSSGTTYYVRAYTTTSSSAVTCYGDEVSFTTLQSPEVSTQEVINILGTTATGQGNITALGNPNPTSYGVCWNTTGTPTIDNSKTNSGTVSATGAFTSSITGLSPSTTYYVRAYTTNDAGTAYGDQISFTTISFNGSGTESDPFQISTLNDLQNFAANTSYWDKYLIQKADIDAASTSTWDDGDGDNPDGWTPIGNSTTKFTGSYDGDGYTIDGLYIYRSSNDYQGMFGATYGAVIKNLAVTGIQITGKQNTGGLIGYSHSSNISNSYTTGSVSGSGSVGGFVGWSEYGSMSKCYSSCNVSCSGGAGGFIGYCSYYCTVANCYSTGTVTGNNSGGFIQGNMYATVSNCYSIGIVSNGGGFIKENYGTINNCFWDTDVSGQSTSSGGTGKTTAEMKSHSTFTEAGWDFFDESTNGSNNYWSKDINKNGGYPYLSWQAFPNSITLTDGSSYETSPTLGQSNQVIGCMALKASSVNASFDGIWIRLNGTRTGANNFKLWESADNSFESASDTQIGSTVSTDPGDCSYIWFQNLSGILSTSDKFYFLTCDLSSDATGAIEPILSDNEDLMLSFATLNSTLADAPLSSTSSALPVELTSFTAALVEDEVTLSWKTATEVNNYGFEIHRASTSLDSQSNTRVWETLGFIEGHGNSNSPKEYQFIDILSSATADKLDLSLEYRLKQIDTDGSFTYYSQTAKVDITITAVEEVEIPTEFALKQNYPNPFNPTTTIQYSIPVVETFCETSLHTTLIVYDMLGRRVATLVNEEKAPGNYLVNFNASKLTSGMYIYRIKAGEFNQSHKMLLLR